MAAKRDVRNVVLETATVSVKLDIRLMLEESILDKFPEASDIKLERLNHERMWDCDPTLDDFWIVVDVVVTE